MRLYAGVKQEKYLTERYVKTWGLRKAEKKMPQGLPPQEQR